MQQMSNILLSNSSKSADVSSKSNVQDVENTSFLSTFNQASESSTAVKNASVKTVDSNIEVPIYDADIENELNKTAEQLSDENSDAEMIFAQLTMADTLGKRNPHGGNELPYVDKSGEYIGRNAQIGPIFDELTEINTADKSFNVNSVDLDSIEFEGEFLTNRINLAEQLTSSEETVAQLSEQELSSLMSFSDLSAQELQALDHGQLSALINDFNLQLPVVDESILTIAEIALDDSEHISFAATMASQQGVSSSGSGATLPDSLADPKAILGDKARIDGNIQPVAVEVKALEKAEFSVVLDSVAGKRANELNVISNTATNGLDMFADVSDVDTKSLQNQSSFTPVHKSEVPQFQLSLRPQAEAGNQMQEMIQKFSPVMKQQLITMVSNGIQQAEIRLDPPELGHLTVKIQIQGDQTQVQFHVAQSQTRDLVEQAIPRLRDMLASEGLQLTDSQVSQGGGGREQQQESSDHQGQTSDSQLDEIAAQEASLMTNTSRSLHSAIDYYA